jgi:arginine:ornithine antiporter/lysine permease
MAASQETSAHEAGTGDAPAPAHNPKKIGLLGLVAVVISAMVGGGIFNLPASVAANASAGAILLGWVITGVGMWFVVSMFRMLAVERPDLTNGLFAYAKEGFGRIWGFIVAYGYWICSCCATAVYGILVMATVGTFLPEFKEGITLPALIGASVITWIMFAIALRGPKTTSVINLIGTVCKIIPLIIYVVAFASIFNLDTFMSHLWGMGEQLDASFNWGSVGPQVMSTLLVTLWVFIGVEGAVVISGQADSQKDVARATTGGFLGTLVLYVVATLLPFGVLNQGEIAGLANPSVAEMMEMVFGTVGARIISVGVFISVLSSWLAWTLMLGQMPTSAAESEVFPPQFKKRNRYGAPVNSLILTSCSTQALLIFSYVAGSSAWLTIIAVTSVMALPCYLCCTLFLVRESRSPRWDTSLFSRRYATIVGVLGVMFALFMIVAAGLDNLLLASGLYALGLILFFLSVKHTNKPMTMHEKAVCLVILGLAVVAVTRFFLSL